METADVITLLVSTTTAVFAAFLSSSLLDRVLEQRQKVMIRAVALDPYKGGAHVWSIRFLLHKPIQESDPVICYLGKPGNKFIGYDVLGSAALIPRVRINDRGHLECDVSFTTPGSEIEVHCRVATRDTPQFYTTQKSLRIRPDHIFQRATTAERMLLVAKLRTLWVCGVILLVSFLALLRLFYLGSLLSLEAVGSHVRPKRPLPAPHRTLLRKR